MDDGSTSADDTQFRLRSGAVIAAGWLRHDVTFLTRSLRFLLRAEAESLRSEAALEAGDIGILAVVSLNPGITQNDLAASVVLKKSAVTRVVQRLEKRGLLTRRRSSSDRRANRLALTPDGLALAERLRDASRARQAGWFRDIPAQDEAVFLDVLFRLVANMAATAQAEPGDDDD